MTDEFHFFITRPGWLLTDEVGYSVGREIHCPRCDSRKISIFFKPGFLGIEIGKWCEYMDKHDFQLCNIFTVIKKHNLNPTWICKDCYDGGVILKN